MMPILGMREVIRGLVASDDISREDDDPPPPRTRMGLSIILWSGLPPFTVRWRGELLPFWRVDRGSVESGRPIQAYDEFKLRRMAKITQADFMLRSG